LLMVTQVTRKGRIGRSSAHGDILGKVVEYVGVGHDGSSRLHVTRRGGTRRARRGRGARGRPERILIRVSGRAHGEEVVALDIVDDVVKRKLNGRSNDAERVVVVVRARAEMVFTVINRILQRRRGEKESRWTEIVGEKSREAESRVLMMMLLRLRLVNGRDVIIRVH
jgi:hypothetical protein